MITQRFGVLALRDSGDEAGSTRFGVIMRSSFCGSAGLVPGVAGEDHRGARLVPRVAGHVCVLVPCQVLPASRCARPGRPVTATKVAGAGAKAIMSATIIVRDEVRTSAITPARLLS